MSSGPVATPCCTSGCQNPRFARSDFCLTCIDGQFLAAGARRVGPFRIASGRVDAICLECDRPCLPRLTDLQRGRHPCRPCAYRRRDDARRLPSEQATKELAEAGYRMTGVFRGVEHPVEAVCVRCGTDCTPRLKKVRIGQTCCPTCAAREKAERLRTDPEVIRVWLDERDLVMIGEFSSVNEPIEAWCKLCEKPTQVWGGNRDRGRGCMPCSRRLAAAPLRLGAEQVREGFAAQGFTMVGPYRNSHTPVELECQRCEHRFPRSWKVFNLGARRCPSCGPPARSRPLTDEETVRARFLSRGLLMTGTYKGNRVPVEAICLTCGTPCSPEPVNLIRQGGCHPCGRAAAAEKIRTPLDVVKEIFDEAGVEFIGPHRGVTERTPGRCRGCGNPVQPKVNQLLNGDGACVACGYTKRRGSWKNANEVPGLLYLLDFDLDGERFCKVGIGKVGSGRVEQWISSCGAQVVQIVYASFADCYAAEQGILSDLSSEAYRPVSPRMKSGHTECFMADLDIDLSEWLRELPR